MTVGNSALPAMTPAHAATVQDAAYMLRSDEDWTDAELVHLREAYENVRSQASGQTVVVPRAEIERLWNLSRECENEREDSRALVEIYVVLTSWLSRCPSCDGYGFHRDYCNVVKLYPEYFRGMETPSGAIVSREGTRDG